MGCSSFVLGLGSNVNFVANEPKGPPADYSWRGGQRHFFSVQRGFRTICPPSWDAFVLPANMHGMWL